MIATNIYKGQTNRLKSLAELRDIEIRKNEEISKIKQTERVLQAYQKVLKKKDLNIAINTINNIAQGSNIVINSLKPVKEEAGAVYIRFPFELSVASGSYHNIAKFINKIEGHSDIYFVDRLHIKSAMDSSGAAQKLSASIILSTVESRGIK